MALFLYLCIFSLINSIAFRDARASAKYIDNLDGAENFKKPSYYELLLILFFSSVSDVPVCKTFLILCLSSISVMWFCLSPSWFRFF